MIQTLSTVMQLFEGPYIYFSVGAASTDLFRKAPPPPPSPSPKKHEFGEQHETGLLPSRANCMLELFL